MNKPCTVCVCGPGLAAVVETPLYLFHQPPLLCKGPGVPKKQGQLNHFPWEAQPLEPMVSLGTQENVLSSFKIEDKYEFLG